MIDYFATDETAMVKLAETLAPCLKVGDVLALQGALGAGKTTLARGLIRALAGEEIEVPSPTFTLVQSYDLTPPVAHFDLYRLARAEDVTELGWDEAVVDSLVIVEWPERLPKLPEGALLIEIVFAGEGRRLIFSGNEEWRTRLEAIFMTPHSAPNAAMILAAGLGERMRPLTLERPKPLLMLGESTILDRVLAHFTAAGISNLVVNAHYKGEMIHAHLHGAPIKISDEATLLETGGGVKQALPLLGKDAFFVANADTVWRDGKVPALQRLAARWDEAAMDALLLLTPAGTYNGDYAIDAEDRIAYRPNGKTAPTLYAGLCLLHPRLFAGAPEGRFSLKLLWDKAEAAGRLFGVMHDGAWYHLGTPEELAAAQGDFR